MSQAHPSGTLPGVPAANASEEFAQAVQTLVPEKLLSGNLPPVKTHSVLTDRPSPAESEITRKRGAVKQEVAALDFDLATRQRAFAEEIARMEEQTAVAKAELACAEHDLRDVRMRLDHTQAVYDEIRRKFA
jgi:hypothetical protein